MPLVEEHEVQSGCWSGASERQGCGTVMVCGRGRGRVGGGGRGVRGVRGMGCHSG